MAVDMFIDLDGIKGESKDHKYKDKIDLLAWSWGMANSGTFHAGGGGGAGKVSVQDISITKYVDVATPTLMLNCCNGKHIAKGTIVIRKAGEKPLEYLKIEMTDILVTSYSTGGSGGEDRLSENVTLNFAKVKTVYTSQDQKGAAAGSVDMGWNIQENVKV